MTPSATLRETFSLRDLSVKHLRESLAPAELDQPRTPVDLLHALFDLELTDGERDTALSEYERVSGVLLPLDSRPLADWPYAKLVRTRQKLERNKLETPAHPAVYALIRIELERREAQDDSSFYERLYWLHLDSWSDETLADLIRRQEYTLLEADRAASRAALSLIKRATAILLARQQPVDIDKAEEAQAPVKG